MLLRKINLPGHPFHEHPVPDDQVVLDGNTWVGVGWLPQERFGLEFYGPELCTTCWCQEGQDVATCMAPTLNHKCECDHYRCGYCDLVFNQTTSPVTTIYNTLVCPGCVDRQPRERLWSGDNPTVKLPFQYAPTVIHNHQYRGNDLYLSETDRLAVQRQVILGLTMHDNVVRLAELYQEDYPYNRFNHYHSGCWGTINYTLRDGETVEELRDRLQKQLTVINGEHMSYRTPNGLPSYFELVEGGSLTGTKGWELNQEDVQRVLKVNRQRRLQLVLPNHVVVVGVGGVGWNLSRALVLTGVNHLTTVDPDRLEEVNLNRLDGTPTEVGRLKVTVFWGRFTGMGTVIDRIGTTVQAHLGTTPADVDVLVDTTDQLNVQAWCYDWCKTNGVRYVRAGYDGGWHITVTSERAPDWDTNPAVGYQVPSWIGGAEMAAQLALIKVCYDPDLEWSGDIRETFGVVKKAVLPAW